MTPDFALDLSHDGISLLRRADDGWRRVGAVSLDADRLVEDLAALREQAGVATGALTTKLVLPNSQILFTHCPASGKDALADEVRVRAALVGATPYEVSDLVFDWESDGETLHIAVVARETLEEARAFAAEHGFGPAGYVAVPPRGAFLREPFFGPVDRGPGAGPGMVADAEPIEVVGAWREPEAPALAAPEAEVPLAAEVMPEDAAQVAKEQEAAEGQPEAATGLASEPESDEPVEAQDGAAGVELAETEAVSEGAPVAAEDAVVEAQAEEPETVAEVEERAAPEETVEQVVEPAQEALADEVAPISEPIAETPEPEAAPDDVPVAAGGEVVEADAGAKAEIADEPAPAEPVAAVSFSSIRASAAEGRAPKLGAARGEDATGVTRKLAGATRGDTPASPPEKPAKTPRTKAKAAPVPEPDALAATLEPAPETLEATPAPKTTPKAAFDDPETAPQDANARSKAAFAAFRDKVAGMRRTSEKGALTPEIIAAPLPRPEPQDLPKRVSQEAKDGELTIFGARGKQTAKGRKGFPIALTVGLVLFLGLVGLWSKLFLAGGDAALNGEAPVQAERAVASTTTQPLLTDDGALTRSITFSEAGTSGATADTEGEAELADALQAPLDDIEASDPVNMASLADDPFSALPEEEPQLAEPMFENPPLPEIDADALPGDDEMADLEPEPEVAGGERMSAEEARAAYAESGVWQQSPELASVSPEASVDDIYIASIDPSVRPHDAVALPRADTGAGSDTEVPRQPSPMPPGQDVEFADDGSITPTEEGIVTGDGVTLYAGRPHVVPRARPGSAAAAEAQAEEAAAEAEAAVEAETQQAGPRPKARPTGLVEENEKAQLGGRTRAEMAGIRPKERPQSVQDEAEASRQAAIEEAVRNSAEENATLQQDEARAQAEAKARAEAELESASRLAVASSRVPAAKPRDFNRRVASAREQAEKEAAEAARQAARAAQSSQETEREETQVASAATVLPRNQKVAPAVPSSASVAKAATSRNALKLRDINLIGVFGSPSQRRALVRLPSGRLVKVKAGDRLDGGKVAAIGQSELRYVKRGKNITLSMPRS